MEYIKLFANGSCHACGSFDKLNVDHCHVTGRIRGMLCCRCNTILGYAEKDITKLDSVKLYYRRKCETEGKIKDDRNATRLECYKKCAARQDANRRKKAIRKPRLELPETKEVLAAMRGIRRALRLKNAETNAEAANTATQ